MRRISKGVAIVGLSAAAALTAGCESNSNANAAHNAVANCETSAQSQTALGQLEQKLDPETACVKALGAMIMGDYDDFPSNEKSAGSLPAGQGVPALRTETLSLDEATTAEVGYQSLGASANKQTGAPLIWLIKVDDAGESFTFTPDVEKLADPSWNLVEQVPGHDAILYNDKNNQATFNGQLDIVARDISMALATAS